MHFESEFTILLSVLQIDKKFLNTHRKQVFPQYLMPRSVNLETITEKN